MAEGDGAKRVSRRTLLRSLMWGSVGIFFAESALAGGAVLWPRKLSGFGAKIVAGTVEDFPPDTVTVVREGKFYISHVTGKDPDTGTDYGTSGLIALYWRCTHLGCTVPWAPPDDPDPMRHFHCPCHGSTFDRVGTNTAGPAPRPLDCMEITIDDEGRIVVDTGTITERSEYHPDQVTKL